MKQNHSNEDDNQFENRQGSESNMKRDAMVDEDAEIEFEEALWKKAGDHEKRKQYKRARKILDLFKEFSE